jgi:archaellum component FlaG (FlaF/FlaG flagellin family)
MKRFLTPFLIVLCLAASPAFAQRTGKQTGTLSAAFTLTVNVNVPGALISVDGAAIKGNSALLKQGSHTVNVNAAGYIPYTTVINLQNNYMLGVELQPAIYTLSVAVNVKSYDFYVDGNGVKGNAVQVVPGSHQVRVLAPGYQPYETTVNVNQSMTVNVALQPTLLTLSVSVDVKNYFFFVDGQSVKGNAVQVVPGNHQVKVQSPGYISYETTVSVNESMNLNVSLQPELYALNIYCDVKDADIFINDQMQNSFQVRLAPGKYTVRAKARGYSEYRETINLNGDYNLKIQMKMLMSGLQVTVPLVRDLKGNRVAQVEVFVDNQQVKPNQRTEIAPGQHRVRAVAGGMQSEMDIQVEAGKEYNIEPVIQLQFSNVILKGQN